MSDELRDERISAAIASLPGDVGPPAVTVLRLGRRRRRLRQITGVLIAAVVLLAVTVTATSGIGARGLLSVDAAVTLQAVAESPHGRRPLADGVVVRADEQVVFRARTTQPGALWILEGSRALYPAATAQWSVTAGEHYPGGQAPLAYRPDDASDGPRVYTLRWCPEQGACVEDRMILVWEASL